MVRAALNIANAAKAHPAAKGFEATHMSVCNCAQCIMWVQFMHENLQKKEIKSPPYEMSYFGGTLVTGWPFRSSALWSLHL